MDILIFDLLRETGFRVDDIMHLRIYEIAVGTKLTTREAKTDKKRSVAISSELSERLRAYSETRNRLSYAFPALRKVKYGRGKMHRTTFARHFFDACRKAGLNGKGYSPHSLRKLYAVRKFKETHDLTLVQQDLGHSSLAVTALYALSDAL